MNDSMTHSPSDEKPSGTRAFLGGFASGTLSGAMMMGVVFTLGAIAAFIPPVAAFAPTVLTMGFLGTATFMSIATGVFGGIMGVKRAYTQPAAITGHESFSPVSVAAPAQSISPELTTAIAFNQAEQPPAKKWVAETGRSSDSQSRVQQILANGSISDKDRASAILAARESATTVAGLGA